MIDKDVLLQSILCKQITFKNGCKSVVHVHMREGRADEQVKEIITWVTNVFVKQGSKLESFRVILHSVQRTN